MSRIRGKNTRPELLVRRLVHGLGFRYRLHRSDLAGTPDLAFIGRRKVIFVHGCFWHGHKCVGREPKSNRDYWVAKITRNKTRDTDNEDLLRGLGWSVLTLWECELKDRAGLADRLKAFLA
jgi:DNA mismatch endonuclease (patch repair protein)